MVTLPIAGVVPCPIHMGSHHWPFGFPSTEDPIHATGSVTTDNPAMPSPPQSSSGVIYPWNKFSRRSSCVW